MKIGLTGGVASGKSTVARAFANLGVAVIDSDRIARDIVAPGQPALAEVVAAFGPEIIGEDGQLDRKSLRELIFSDSSRRARLEAILHPRIAAELHALAEAAGGPYQVLEIPLLLETGMQTQVDRVLVVDCPVEAQVQRLIERDGGTASDAHRIVAAQTGRDRRLAAADDVIVNDGALDSLDWSVRALDRSYREISGDDPAIPI